MRRSIQFIWNCKNTSQCIQTVPLDLPLETHLHIFRHSMLTKLHAFFGELAAIKTGLNYHT